MESWKVIQNHFPEINDDQAVKFQALGDLYSYWNDRINVVSRKDIEYLYTRHVLHSLGIARFIRFGAGEKILDVGTGGGFPGIPLAILFPDASFTLMDSIAKKIRVVREIGTALKLENINAQAERVENTREKYHFLVSRAVTRLRPFLDLTSRCYLAKGAGNAFPNGLFYLKGGDLGEELAEVKRTHRVFSLKEEFTDPFFETKKVVYVRYG